MADPGIYAHFNSGDWKGPFEDNDPRTPVDGVKHYTIVGPDGVTWPFRALSLKEARAIYGLLVRLHAEEEVEKVLSQIEDLIRESLEEVQEEIRRTLGEKTKLLDEDRERLLAAAVERSKEFLDDLQARFGPSPASPIPD